MLPSIRELELGLQRTGEPETERERTALRIARALLSYVRNFGTPPAEPVNLKLQHQSLKPRATVPQKRFVIHQPNLERKPDGALTIQEVAKEAGYSPAHLRTLMYSGVLPHPAVQGGSTGPSYWTREQVQRIKAIAVERKANRPPPPGAKRRAA